MMFFAFMMYPHYEMIRKLAYEVKYSKREIG